MRATERSAGEVFGTFLKLGLTSFGGPIAHLAYFRDELVVRRKWLDDREYADLVALCQFLPGPASSQVGFALGLMRAGWAGGLMAFLAFAVPSACLLILFATLAVNLTGPIGIGVLSGLKIVAVAIVAQAVLGMARSLCPDKERASIAVAALASVSLLEGATGMLAAIVIGAVAGLMFNRGTASSERGQLSTGVNQRTASASLAIFVTLMIALPLLAQQNSYLAVVDGFYRAGSLVFGGGHVVLPLLEAETVGTGWVTPEQFVAGYGAAQAVPGPLFTFAAYLGAVKSGVPNGLGGAFIALLAIFLPGFLLLVGALPFWDRLRRKAGAQSLMQGTNAAVVGVLGAALYSPVFTSAIHDVRAFALAVICLLLLMSWKIAPVLAVVFASVGGVALQLVH